MNNPNELQGNETVRFQSPFRTLIVLSLTLFLAELVVMFLLPFLPPYPPWIYNLLDPLLMLLLSFPALYFGVLRPLSRHIRERQREELERQRLREELAHMSRVTTVGQLAASLIHQLSQPLAAIRCNAQAAEHLLTSAKSEIQETLAALTDIQNDSQRASEVVQRLRDWFKKNSLDRSPVHLNEVISETIDLLRSEFVLKSVHVQSSLDSALPPILANRVELQQVILNLVMNGIEAMSGLEPPLRQLHVSTFWVDSHFIGIAVRDFGTGIPAALLPRLFEPFRTTKKSGMGMGLMICHSIVEAHGGRLWAENNPDRGATFRVAFPAYLEHIS